MRKTYPKLLKIIGIILAVPLVCFCSIIILQNFVLSLSSYQQSVAWRRSTSPLPEQVVKDLCNKLALPAEDQLCTSDDILARDFYPIIRKAFPPGETRYQDIQNVLEEYQSESEQLGRLADGQKYYRVSYDLRGDGTSAIIYYFYENGLSFRVQDYYEGID
jgi:hypothetical protein